MSAADVHEPLILRDVAMSDAAACEELSRVVGWPHRVEDWEMVISLGHGVVATLGEDIVGTALWWPYGEAHATLGMIIVSPERQGGGIGKKLMNAVFEQAEGRSLMLNATVAGEPLYARCGFVRHGGAAQYHGQPAATPAPEPAAGDRLRPMVPADLPLLERLDLQATGLSRGHVLATLIGCGEGVVLERGGEPVGFSILRRFGRGFVVGPVVAPGSAEARLLIAHWLHERQGQFLRVDLPAGSGLEDWLTERGLKHAGPVTGMVRGTPPVAPGPARLYALVNQALG